MRELDKKGFSRLLKKENIELIDVRMQKEADILKFKNSKLINLNQIREREEEIDFTSPVVFYCRTGARSGIAANLLNLKGDKIYNLSRGIKAYYKDKDFLDLIEFGDIKNLSQYF